jgi:hypothetical protein
LFVDKDKIFEVSNIVQHSLTPRQAQHLPHDVARYFESALKEATRWNEAPKKVKDLMLLHTQDQILRSFGEAPSATSTSAVAAMTTTTPTTHRTEDPMEY